MPSFTTAWSTQAEKEMGSGVRSWECGWVRGGEEGRVTEVDKKRFVRKSWHRFLISADQNVNNLNPVFLLEMNQDLHYERGFF